jgi:hypothetical protein
MLWVIIINQIIYCWNLDDKSIWKPKSRKINASNLYNIFSLR